jgi:hypothetical protein
MLNLKMLYINFLYPCYTVQPAGIDVVVVVVVVVAGWLYEQKKLDLLLILMTSLSQNEAP